MPTTLKEFEAVFPTLVKDMKEHCQKYKLPDQALNWFEQVCRWIPDKRTEDHGLMYSRSPSTTTL